MAVMPALCQLFCIGIAAAVVVTGYEEYEAASNSEDNWVTVQDSLPRQVRAYRNYGDIVLFHFRMPAEVREASFRFRANITRHCAMDRVQLYLQHGSFPVVNPLNTSFPDGFFLDVGSESLKHAVVVTDNSFTFINVTTPEPGDWFSVAFNLDDSERIVQKGLFVPCKILVSCSLNIQMAEEIHDLSTDRSSDHSLSRPTYFRFTLPSHAWDVHCSITNCSASMANPCPVVVRAASGVLPTNASISYDEVSSSINVLNCSTAYFSRCCGGLLLPRLGTRSYLLVEPLEGSVNFTMMIEPTVCSRRTTLPSHRNEPRLQKLLQMLSSNASELHRLFEDLIGPPAVGNTICWPTYMLKHVDSVESFDYSYKFAETTFSTNTSINITASSPTLLIFDVYPRVGIGGTLSIKLTIKHPVDRQQNVTVRAGMSYGVRPWLDPQAGTWQSAAVLNVNTTKEEFLSGKLHIPFPKAGLWYLGLLPLCSVYYLGNESHPGYMPCNADRIDLEVHINASACLSNNCGKFGECYQYSSDGFIFSSCVCRAGYRGWGCTDNREALSEVRLITNVLLLTLSNTAMIPAIITAFWRQYFLEGVVYTVTMFASIVYHTCDAQLSPFCLAPLNVLQFCDFLTSIVAFWVTLMAMAKIPEGARHLSCTLGVLVIAVVVRYDPTGLIAFALPIAVALTFVLVSWAHQCYGHRTCYPERRAWLLSIGPGALLTGAGAVLYAFCETRKNYPYVHSAWHALVGVALLCVLPRQWQRHNGVSRIPSKMSNYVPVPETSNGRTVENPVAEHIVVHPPAGFCCVP